MSPNSIESSDCYDPPPHLCEGSSHGNIVIIIEKGKWFLMLIEEWEAYEIVYCPFCGVKL